MRELQNLLNQVSTITKKNEEILDATGGRFNIFKILGTNHYENTHSAIIAEFLNPKGSHGLKNKFLQTFLEQIHLTEILRNFDSINAEVKTEASTQNGRIDILIHDNNGNAIIIENKIYASDQSQQLKRYNDFAKEKYTKHKILYLTLFGSEASKDSGDGIDYMQISYADHMVSWLEKCLHQSVRHPIVRETIAQYINHLKKLTNQDMDQKNNCELVDLLSKRENIESAIKIADTIKEVKEKILRAMCQDIVSKVSTEYSIKFSIKNNCNTIIFYKEGWKEDCGIWFASDYGKTYYSIKTLESLKGTAILQKRIDGLFEKKGDHYNPYGWEYVSNHWSNNPDLFIKIENGSFAKEIIIPRIEKVLKLSQRTS